MFRKILAVLAGLLTGGTLILLMESGGRWLHPLPDNIKPDDTNALISHAVSAPVSSKLWVLSGWALAAMVGGFVATWVSRERRNSSAMTMAGIFLVLSAVNMVVIPSPWWFWLLGISLWIPLSLFGYRRARYFLKEGENGS